MRKVIVHEGGYLILVAKYIFKTQSHIYLSGIINII